MAERTLTEKVGIFRRLFTGMDNVYGTYDTRTGKVRQVKEPVTDKVIQAHLAGKRSYGVYLLTGDRTRALAVDFDEDELSVPVTFVDRAKRYEIPTYIEISKSKGYHVWMFFEKGGVSARKARLIAHKILTDIGKPQTEVFPKQDRLTDGILYGNFINACMFGKLVPKGRTVFVDPADPTRPYPDQWELLVRVQRVPELKLDTIIKRFNLTVQIPATSGRKNNNDFTSDNTWGLPACTRRMLAQGVSSYQRVSCFRLAVHLKRNGMPYDQVVTTLKAWAQRNRPEDGKRIITDREIEAQTRDAFKKSYRSFGCEEPAIARYCDPNCPIRLHRTKGSTAACRNYAAKHSQ